jgi:hypothetical protein
MMEMKMEGLKLARTSDEWTGRGLQQGRRERETDKVEDRETPTRLSRESIQQD